jgi:hypothetical protein
MEININIFNKLVSLVDNSRKNKNYELEARFWNKDKMIINSENFNKVFQKLTFSKDNNGFGYSKYEMKNILDIILDKSSVNEGYESLRLSINGEDDIKKYWLNNLIEGLNTTFIEKESLDKVDDTNYNLRFSLKNEIPQNNILKKNIDLILSNTVDKLFRFKNRYSIKTDDKLFQIDMSSIKSGIGKSFKESNTLKDKITYEIEIEYIGKDLNIDNEMVANKLFSHCYNILKILKNTDFIISNTLINEIKDNYKNLANLRYPDEFIAASPVTLHRENLFKSDEIKNIYEHYAVTLKADGERNFLIVNPDDGKLYIFNNNFNFMDTGYTDNDWKGTLIEAEYIEGTNELYMYDILFSKKNDVRRRHLIDFKKDPKFETRLQILDNFLKSSSRKVSEGFPEELNIKLHNKKYIQTVRGDGSDIFQKTKELWDNRKLNSFNVDGIIFTPKYEYYPNRKGSWYSLFKWKPPNLNSIDFLIRTKKDNNKNDIKSPYIQVIDRLDGKKETIIKQYKTIELFVSGEKKVVSDMNRSNQQNNRKIYSKRIPILFNPFGDENSLMYNNTNLFVEDDGKIYAYDPLSNEKVEIYDDIIVECGYDASLEEGFRWIPIRFRRDKTNLYKSGKDVFGNDERIANDIFRAINNPVTEEMILTGIIPITNNSGSSDVKIYYQRDESNIRFPYQNFHNLYIKYELLYLSSPTFLYQTKEYTNGKILDMCCGRGTDINKIKRAKYAEIVGIDIDYKNIKDAQEFYKTIVPSPKPKAYYTRANSGKLIFPNQEAGITEFDKKNLKKFIPTKFIFDTVSLQFCFHYFFENEISLRTVIQNMNDNLKIGGYVIGTTFDGERVYDQLKNSDSISGKTFSGDIMWKIDKKYSSTKLDFTDKKANYGKTINVFVKTIGVPHEEYLVNFHFLDKIMEEYGFSKIFIKPFNQFYDELLEKKNTLNLSDKEIDRYIDNIQKMSEEEKRFSFLSSGFMYKKEKNSSDSLYKKLVDLIEKKEIKEGKQSKQEGQEKQEEKFINLPKETYIEDSEEDVSD